jgi:Ca2+-binding RTX toxin-like protein
MLVAAAMLLGVLMASGVALAITKIGTNGPDIIRGTNKADMLSGRGGNDTVMGLAGSDNLNGGYGSDDLRGGRGGDNLNAWRGDDVLYGGLGKDDLYGVQGADVMHGGPGDDRLFAKNAHPSKDKRDTLYCGKGMDKYGADKVDFVSRSCELNRGYVLDINPPASASAAATE